MCEQFHRLAWLRKFIIRRKRNNHLVTDAVDLDGDLGRKRLDELAVEKGDHGAGSSRLISSLVRRNYIAPFPAHVPAPGPMHPQHRVRELLAAATNVGPFWPLPAFALRRSRRWPVSLFVGRVH